MATIALIVVLERTRLGALGLVLAVAVTSAAAAALGWQVATLNDLGVVLGSLPRPELPVLALVPSLVVPALSLAFVGLVQGASISANYPNPDGSYPDVSRDFAGQGAANVAAGAVPGHAGRRVRSRPRRSTRRPAPGRARPSSSPAW